MITARKKAPAGKENIIFSFFDGRKQGLTKFENLEFSVDKSVFWLYTLGNLKRR